MKPFRTFEKRWGALEVLGYTPGLKGKKTMKLRRFLLRYYPPGIILEYEQKDRTRNKKEIDLLNLTPVCVWLRVEVEDEGGASFSFLCLIHVATVC